MLKDDVQGIPEHCRARDLPRDSCSATLHATKPMSDGVAPGGRSAFAGRFLASAFGAVVLMSCVASPPPRTRRFEAPPGLSAECIGGDIGENHRIIVRLNGVAISCIWPRYVEEIESQHYEGAPVALDLAYG